MIKMVESDVIAGNQMRGGLSPVATSTLKEVGLLIGLDGQSKLKTNELAARLDVSSQTVSRRLQSLEDSGHLDRDIEDDQQQVSITKTGKRHLRTEYEDYREIFGATDEVTLLGAVTSGMGEGRHYISLSGYMRQFREKLGYEPFPGTLNVDLDEASIRKRHRLSDINPITIEGWSDDERTYGPVYCYKAVLEADHKRYEQAHVVGPERTHHGDKNVEIVAPDELREEFELDDGDELRIRVEK